MASAQERLDDIRAAVLAALSDRVPATLDAVRRTARTHVDRLTTTELFNAVAGLERDGRIVCDADVLRLR